MAAQQSSSSIPDPAGGGGAGAPAVQPVQGQGQGAPQGQAGFRQHFPDVPDEHWALIEPHVGQIEAHTTQLQQQVAPFKALTDAGYDAQTLQGLVQFDQNFRSDPLAVWLKMGEALQQPGQNGRSAVHPDVDMEYLAAIARGEDPDAGSVPGIQPGADPQQTPAGAVPPELAQYIQGLEQQIQGLQGELQQDRTDRQTQVQDQLYTRRLDQMRGALKGAGYAENTLDDRSLTAHVIAYNGNFAAATKALIDQRSALLQGFVNNRQQEPEPTELPNGAPPTANRETPARDRKDPFKVARRNAEARMKRANQST